ncbi:hypothetical protein D4R75_07040 [bacterium]|nr:MAG: hypothetical protein D4R75_07040 [bacterium]
MGSLFIFNGKVAIAAIKCNHSEAKCQADYSVAANPPEAVFRLEILALLRIFLIRRLQRE